MVAPGKRVERDPTPTVLPEKRGDGLDAQRDVEELKERARRLARATPPKLRLSFGQTFCAAVIERYWQSMRPRCRQVIRPAPAVQGSPSLGREGLATSVALAELAATFNVDEASYVIGRTYAAMLPEEYRAKYGVYYTPPAVVTQLLNSASNAGVNWAECRALDPACGGGAFLGPLARRMLEGLKEANRRVVLRNLQTRLRGYELDTFAAWMSSVFLDATLNEVVGFVGDESFTAVEVGDSLERIDEEGGFDLVVGNPPYGRVTLPTALRERYRRALFGHANQYALFLDLALRKAKEGGVVAYVTPTGFLSGEYFKNLRAVLASEAPPVTFDFIGERSGVFDDVLQETLLVCFRRGDRPRAADVRFVETRGSDRLTVRKTGKVAPRSLSEGPWVIPRSPGSAGLARRLLSMSTRLSDWGYRVSTGPLVWNRHKSQLRHRRNGSTVPIIWAEAVSADGEFCFRAARRNHSPYFALKEGDEWLIVRKSCVLLQRTTAKEQPHRLIAAELPESFIEESGGAVTVENHLNMIVSTVSKPPVSTQALAAFLNSTAADRVFRCISGTVAVSAYELESMPLPAAWTMRELDGFLERGEEAKLEAYCERLYGKQ